MHLACAVSRAAPVISDLIPEVPQHVLRSACAYACQSGWLLTAYQDEDG